MTALIIYHMKYNLKPFYPYILALIVILIFAYLSKEMLEIDIYKLDLSVNAWAAGLRTPFWTQVMKLITDIGVIGGTFVIGVLAARLWFQRHSKLAVALLCSGLGAGVFTSILKVIIARNRPELTNRLVTETSFSFPSGHATTAFVAFPILAIMVYYSSRFPKAVQYFLIALLSLFPFVVAFSRLYLGVHYLTDVVAGAVVGLCATCVFYYFHSKYNHD
jgi:undecaprenyl-diphosphatase